jgi:glycosyltransferase involved in cell wall biosynthesis
MGVGHVTTIHGGRYWAGALRRKILFRLAIGLGGEVAAVSETLRCQLAEDLRLPERRIRYIPNGVPSDLTGNRDALRTELGLSESDRLVVAIGNLYPVKGHRILVEALKTLGGRHPQLHVAIAGRGAEEEPLRRQADALGIGDRLHLLGLRPDVPDLLSAADVFVMPSLSEGLPMALLEAIFSRTPVVASAVGAIPDVLEHGEGGKLVPPGESEALAAAIDELVTDSAAAARMAAQARRNAIALYSLDAMVERYLEVYAPLIG